MTLIEEIEGHAFDEASKELFAVLTAYGLPEPDALTAIVAAAHILSRDVPADGGGLGDRAAEFHDVLKAVHRRLHGAGPRLGVDNSTHHPVKNRT